MDVFATVCLSFLFVVMCLICLVVKVVYIHDKKGRYYSEVDFDPTYFYYVNWFVS